MSQQSKDLTVIHLHIDTVDSTEPSLEDFLQIFDPQVLILRFKALANYWWSLVVILRHLLRFK